MSAGRLPARLGSVIVEIRGLTKVYEEKPRVVAVDGIDLSVEQGEIFGLLGPNGAGKTTTISIATTRALPTSGQVTIAGVDVVARPATARRNIGVVPQYNTLDRSLTVFENLYFHCRYFGFSSADSKTRAQQLLSQFTVLLTTHYMEEADEICHRVAIMDHGKLLAQDTPELLKTRLGAQTIFELKLRQMEGSTELVKTLERLPNVASVETISDGIRVFSQGTDGLLPQIVQAAQSLGLRDISINEPSLETVFIRLTGRDLRD